MRQCFDVKPASADNDRELSARINFFNRASRSAPVLLRVHFFSQRQHADEVMRCFRQRWMLRFCRKQIQSTVNLKRVGTDNLRANFARDIGCNFGFSGCGRTDNKKRAMNQTQAPADYSSRAAFTIWTKLRGSRLAPPTRAPSMSGWLMSSRAFSGFTLPPY